MKKLATRLKSIWKDESAQGATEYILLLVAVVALVVFFGPEIKRLVQDKTRELSDSISGFSP